MRRWMMAGMVLLGMYWAGCASSIKFEVKGPTAGQLSIGEGVADCTIPCKLRVKTGTYKATLLVPGDYATRLGEKGRFRLFGFLTVGSPTNNSKFAFVQLRLTDSLLISAQRDGKVIETFTYDTGSNGAVLVKIKLGNSRPW